MWSETRKSNPFFDTMGEHAEPRSSTEKAASIHEENVDGIRVEIVQGSMGLEMARRTHPPEPWSRAMLQLYACLVVGYLCSALNGRVKTPGGRSSIES